jgi:dsDNA-binding SOS-regulon protein
MTDAHQRTLVRVLHNIAEERCYEDYKFEVVPTFTGGANYSSRLFRGKITAPNREDLKFFAKVADVNEKFRAQVPTDLFFTEQYTYRKLANIFDKIQDDNGVSKEDRLRMPALYGYAEEPPQEVVVLEDLAADGFATQNRLEAFEWSFAAAAVEQLAVLHSLSIAMRHNYPQEFEDMKKTLIYKKLDENDQTMAATIESMVKKAIESTKEENRERLATYLTENTQKMMELFYTERELPVLVHGDFRMSNTMHKDLEVRS